MMARFFFNLMIALTFSLVSVSFASEQEAIDLFKKGKQYFDNKQYQEAYDYFFEAFQIDPGNLDINFYLGRAAFEKGNYEAAVMAFERILMMHPDAMRVKLEMGRSYFKLKSYQLARQYFKEVLDTNPPDQDRRNIENFLAAIDAAETRHFFIATVSTGITWDDNIRVTPAEDRIRTVIGDVTLTGENATPQSDRIFNITAILSHAYQFQEPWLSWRSSGINYNAIYKFADDLDQIYFNLTTGPDMVLREYLLGVRGIANQLYLDGDRYLGTLGIGSTLTFPLMPYQMVDIGLKGEKKYFFQDKHKDAVNLQIAAGSIFTWTSNRIGVTLTGESEDAEDDINSYNRYGVMLNYSRLLPLDFIFSASVRYQRTKYEEYESLFGEKRCDDVTDINFGLSKTLWRSSDKHRSLFFSLSYAHTDSDSNLDLYIYKKNVTSTAFQFRF